MTRHKSMPPQELKAAEQDYKRREVSGQTEGEPLVDWLNSKPKSPKQKQQRERVIKLLRLLAESVRCQKATEGGFPPPVAVYIFYRRIDRLLSRYKYVPDIRLTWQGNLLSGPPWKLPRPDAYDDRQAVWAISRLAERGRLSAIHECDGCGKWIFTKKSDHATCSAVCRARKRRKTMSRWDLEEIRKKARARYWFRKTHVVKRGKHGKR